MGRFVPVPSVKPTAFLFDWDNTLVDTFELIYTCTNAALAHVGRPTWSFEEARRRTHLSARDSAIDFFGDRWREAHKVYYQTFEAEHLNTLTPFFDAADLLDVLAARGIPLGVVSNKRGSYLRAEVDKLGWTARFSAIVGAQDAPKDKPHADPALLALRHMGVEPSRCVYMVGDTVADVGCAYAAGLTAVLQRPEAPRPGEFHPHDPHFFAQNPTSLKKLLTEIGFI
jgi:phosphoglycolate phosphatase